MKQGLDRGRRQPPCSIVLRSHARANFQSRMTVTGAISRTSAISSTVRPAKYRSSTTRAFRSSVFREERQRLVQSDDIRRRLRPHDRDVVQRDVDGAAAAFGVAAGPRIVDENAPHDLRGQREEVGAIVEIRPPLIDQPEVRFVDERAGLQGMIGAFAAHQAMGHAMQLVVNELDQTIEGRGVAALPAVQQPCHVRCVRLSHYNSHEVSHMPGSIRKY